MSPQIEKARMWWVEQPSKVRLTVIVMVALVPLYFMVDVMFPEPSQTQGSAQKYSKPASVFASSAGVEKMDAEHTEATLEALKNQIRKRESIIDAKEMERQASETRLQQQIDQSRIEAANGNEDIAELKRQIEALSSYVTKNKVNPQNSNQLSYTNTKPSAKPTPKPGQFTLNPILKHQQLQQPIPRNVVPNRPLSLSRGDDVVGSTKKTGDEVQLTKAEINAKKVVAQNDSGKVNAQIDDTPETWLSAGTILTGTLVTGHNVPTSGNANRDPAPVMIKITKEGIMPNNHSIDLRGCIVIGSARGDLSTRRVSIRAEVISCIDDQGRAIEQPLMASAQGPDGQGGMPAKMVTRFGESVKQSALAGVYSTLAETSVSLANNSGTKIGSTNDISGVLGSAVAGGAVTGFDKIAEFYLELANEARPYLEMQPGIEGVDLVIQRGQSLKWKG